MELRNVIEYEANNSGGHWWLSDDNWRALEAAGWVVRWFHAESTPHESSHEIEGQWRTAPHCHVGGDVLLRSESDGTRFIGALATGAAKETTVPQAAVEEWEQVTGQDASAEGCNCCGSPHSFTFYDADGKMRYTSVEVVSTRLTWG